jgi:hypothetical protein
MEMTKRNEPTTAEDRSPAGAVRPSGGLVGKRHHSIAAVTADPPSSAMHRLNSLYAAVAREPLPQALAALLERLKT